MHRHPEALDLIELARRGVDDDRTRHVHHHCLVCDDCQAMLDAVLQLRQAFAQPTAALPTLVATAATQ